MRKKQEKPFPQGEPSGGGSVFKKKRASPHAHAPCSAFLLFLSILSLSSLLFSFFRSPCPMMIDLLWSCCILFSPCSLFVPFSESTQTRGALRIRMATANAGPRLHTDPLFLLFGVAILLKKKRLAVLCEPTLRSLIFFFRSMPYILIGPQASACISLRSTAACS